MSNNECARVSTILGVYALFCFDQFISSIGLRNKVQSCSVLILLFPRNLSNYGEIIGLPFVLRD